ncbi:MAG: hypothetical protein KY468_13620 [Armatimonadetes bacterium]|nr:hypothetical protein [Armatimonadota bacterium]
MNQIDTPTTASSDEITFDSQESASQESAEERLQSPEMHAAPESEGYTSSTTPSSDLQGGEAVEDDLGTGIEARSTLSALDPRSPYDDAPMISALPAPRMEESIQVWEPPSPTAWRKSALTHAGSMVFGAAVALGAFVAFGPKQVVKVPAPPPIDRLAAAPPQGMTPGLIPGGADGNAPGAVPPAALGGDGNIALPPGSEIPGATPNSMPNVPPGTGVPDPGTATPSTPAGAGGSTAPRSGGSIPAIPNANLRLPPLVGPPPQIRPAGDLPPLPPGAFPGGNVGRPPINLARPTLPQDTIPAGLPQAPVAKPKGPTAPSVRAGVNGGRVVAVTPPPTRAADPDEDTDQAISRLRKSVDSNPKDAATLLQLEKLYRRKLIQADRVDEMERYRSLADESRDRAKNILTGDGPKPAPKATGTNAANTGDGAADKPEAKPADGDGAKPAEAPAKSG